MQPSSPAKPACFSSIGLDFEHVPLLSCELQRALSFSSRDGPAHAGASPLPIVPSTLQAAVATRLRPSTRRAFVLKQHPPPAHAAFLRPARGGQAPQRRGHTASAGSAPPPPRRSIPGDPTVQGWPAGRSSGAAAEPPAALPGRRLRAGGPRPALRASSTRPPGMTSRPGLGPPRHPAGARTAALVAPDKLLGNSAARAPSPRTPHPQTPAHIPTITQAAAAAAAAAAMARHSSRTAPGAAVVRGYARAAAWTATKGTAVQALGPTRGRGAVPAFH